jgi:heat shock protein HslJ
LFDRDHCNFRGCLLALAALALAAMQGCSTAPAPVEAPRQAAPVPMPVTVPDGSWELITSTFVGAGRIPGVPRATLAFRDGRVSAFGGCNSANAGARNTAGRLEVLALSTTRRSCPEPLGAFETRFFKLLQAQPVFRIDSDTLTLAAGDHSARFRRVADRPAANEL